MTGDPKDGGDDVRRDALRLWDELAEWWDRDVADGDPFHRSLIFPPMRELSAIRPGQSVLDLGCGNGALLRELWIPGIRAVAVDGSAALVERARARSRAIAAGGNATFAVVDATDAAALRGVAADGKFDLVVCSMVLHDLPTLDPLRDALPDLLAPNGRFLFSLPHPAFNSCYNEFDTGGGDCTIRVKGYIRPVAQREHAKSGQPVPHYNFHRPLSDVFATLADAGLVMDAFREPTLARDGDPGGLAQSLWGRCPEIPPVIVSRWRRLEVERP